MSGEQSLWQDRTPPELIHNPNPALLTEAGFFITLGPGEKAMSHKVSIVIEKDDFGYYAYSPELEGCQSQGDTFEEVMANIKEAIELYLSTLSEEEIRQAVSKEIMTTAVEVRLA